MKRTTAKEVSDRLASQIERVCQYLLPNGKQVQSEWCVGSPAGEAGDSMKVHTSGDKAGVWADFAGDLSGDALDLWAACRNVSLPEAMAEAKRWLGISEPVPPRKKYDKPKLTGVTRLDLNGKVAAYLREERQLSPETLAKFKVSEDGAQKGYYMPSFHPNGELARFKWVALRRENGKKVMNSSINSAPILYGWQAIPRNTRTILICEGEIDAMTWSQWGIPALSVPNGAKNLQWLDEDWDALEPYDEVFISFDMDDVGESVVKDVANRIGLHRAKIVRLPRKDANEWHVKDSPTEAEVMAVLAGATVISPIQFLEQTKLIEEAWEAMTNPNRDGMRTRLFEDKLVFRPGETTVVTGYPGHGKSTLLFGIMVEAATKGHKVVIASMEMPVTQQLIIMAKQFYSRCDITKEQLAAFIEWTVGRIYCLDVYGMVSVEDVIGLMEYGAKRFGCRFAVIDSIMKLNINSEDFEGQRLVTNKLTCFAKENKMHLFLVAHPRKGMTENEKLGMLDVKGAQDIIAQPDNVLVVHRNKRREKMASLGRIGEGSQGAIICDKQRVTGHIFEIETEFHAGAAQFTQEGEDPVDYSTRTDME